MATKKLSTNKKAHAKNKSTAQEPESFLKNPDYEPLLKFAHRTGYSVTGLYNFIAAGKLTAEIEKGRKYIHIKNGLEEMKGIARKSTSNASQKEEQAARAAIPVQGDLGSGPLDVLSDAVDHSVPTAGMTYAQSRAYREAFEARSKELEFRKKAGTLIDKKDVEKRAFEAGRIVRDALMGIPDRIAAELAAERDTNVVHSKLTSALAQALESLAAVAPDLEGAEPEQEEAVDAAPSTPEA